MVMALIACDDDERVTEIRDCLGDCRFEDQSQKWHVLNNLEQAYNRRRIDKYDPVLDENFMFFLTNADVGGGLPEQWGRTVEMNANTNLFQYDPPDPLPRCETIDLDIRWEDSEGSSSVTWEEIPGPGVEKWYTTTVFYDFQFRVEPDTYYISNPGAKAQFTIRNAGTDEVPNWKLVEMRDLGALELVAPSSGGTEQSTWGEVKALYRN
jgi:hypothetical protein